MNSAIKPWHQSQTILCIIAALVIQLARRLGVDILPGDAQQIAMLLSDLVTVALTAGAVHGRVKASTAIARRRNGSPPLPPLPALIFAAGLAMAAPLAACSHLESPYTGTTPQSQVLAFKGYAAPIIDAAAIYLEQGQPSAETKAGIKDAVIAIRDGVAKAEAAAGRGDDPGVAAAIEAARHAAGLIIPILQHKGLLP